MPFGITSAEQRHGNIARMQALMDAMQEARRRELVPAMDIAEKAEAAKERKWKERWREKGWEREDRLRKEALKRALPPISPIPTKAAPPAPKGGGRVGAVGGGGLGAALEDLLPNLEDDDDDGEADKLAELERERRRQKAQAKWEAEYGVGEETGKGAFGVAPMRGIETRPELGDVTYKQQRPEIMSTYKREARMRTLQKLRELFGGPKEEPMPAPTEPGMFDPTTLYKGVSDTEKRRQARIAHMKKLRASLAKKKKRKGSLRYKSR